MGSTVVSICGNTDFFRDLLLKYGEMFIKLIISQKMKMQLQQKFNEIMAKIKEYVDMFLKKVNEIVDEKIKQLTQMFEELKGNINEMFPGRIEELQMKKGISINEFTGFNDFLFKIDEVRDKSLQQLQEQHSDIQKQLHQKNTKLYNEIEEQRPKVPMYENFSDKTKFKMLKKAENEFGERIEEGQKQMQVKCDRSFGEDVDKMDGLFDKINPEKFLNDFVTKSAAQMFKKMAGDVGCGVCCGSCVN